MPTSDVLLAFLERVLGSLQPTYNRLLAYSKIPSNALASRISAKHFPAVLHLHLAVFDTSPCEVMRRLSGDSTVVNYHLDLSTALLLGDDVIGTTLVLAHTDISTAYIYAVIVHARYRRTWATAYLKFHSLAHLVSQGFTHIAFQAFADNSDTLSHARKVGAETIAGITS